MLEQVNRSVSFLDHLIIIQHQRRKSDLELRPTATLQALVDDSNCDFKKLKLNPNDTADETMYQTLRALTLK